MTSFALRMQHSSLQFSDSAPQQEHDVKALFEKGTRFPIKTGTEAGPVDVGKGAGGIHNREMLTEYAHQFDHAINFAGDAWIAVDRKIVVPKSLKKEDVFLVSNDRFAGGIHGSDRIMPTISFDHVMDGVGRINAGSVHYPTKGAEPGSPNHLINQECADKIGRWMARVGAGQGLAFVNGDFNMNDRTLDVALGNKFTTMADETTNWQNTGHGPIDGMCSYDRDGRVSAHKFDVLDDSEFKLFSDHYLCRGTWEIRLLTLS